MAIYRTGQASMDANGYITGYGTKWKTALTLIRPGATIVFASNPVAYATISEIVSDTSLRAISSGGVVVPKGDYVILLHDSLTVDGLAQDVAETLRYYQGQETMYQEFVEFLKGFDWQRMEQLGEKAYADAKAAEASANAAKASETNANASKNAAAGSATTASQKATEAANSAGAAKTSETNANASKTAAANSATAAANSATTAGKHKDAAAASASAAKTSEGNASSSKNAAAASASAAKTSETNAKASEASATASKNAAKTSEDNAAASKNAAASSASAAAGSATSASNSAATAKSEADRAADLAKQLDATNLMRKDANLSDVENNDQARRNIGAFQQKQNSLTGSDNLNDIFGYQKTGYYHNAGNVNATPANNYPIAQAGVLLVTSSQANGVDQTQQYYYPFARHDIYYVRHYNLVDGSWVWTAWTEYKGSQGILDSVGLNRTGVIGPANANDIQSNCFFAGGGTNAQNYILPYQGGIAMRRVNTTSQMQIDAGNGQIWTRGSVDGGDWSEWRRAAMENAVVTFQNAYLDAKNDGDRAASGIMNGRLLSANGSTIRHYWRVYSEIRSDNKTYMTFHLRGANGSDKYLGFNQDGDLSGITDLKCTRVETIGGALISNASGPCFQMKGNSDNASLFMIGVDRDGSNNWYVGKGGPDNNIMLHSYKHGTTIMLRSGEIYANKEFRTGGNVVCEGSSVYVDGGSGTSSTHFWMRNTSKRSRAVIYSNDSQNLTLRSDNGSTGASGQGFTLNGATGECKAVKFTSTSDERAKFWIKPVTGALDKICSLRGVTYSMHTTIQNTVRNAGVIAQDVQKVLPEAVTVTEGDDHAVLNKNCDKVDNPLSLDYNSLSALYVEAFKELKAENESLRAEIESMKAAIAQMQTMLTQSAK